MSWKNRQSSEKLGKNGGKKFYLTRRPRAGGRKGKGRKKGIKAISLSNSIEQDIKSAAR